MKIRSILIFCFFLAPLTLKAACIGIHLEHAITVEEKEWGLMNRDSLPEGKGMLFHYSKPQIIYIWAFNCKIDLSVAFLDEEGTIIDLQELKAYPQKMDPQRPITTRRDFTLYPPNDPLVVHFMTESISSRRPAKYALEVPSGWFKRMGIEVGDQLRWKGDRGFITAQRAIQEF